MEFQEDKRNTRNKTKRSAGIVSAILLAAILALALLGSSQIILLILLYICIGLAGLCVSLFIAYSRTDESDALEVVSKKENMAKGNDVVYSMNIFVKYASRGSDHSRREIARIIKNLIDDNASKKYRDLFSDVLFASDYEKIVTLYTNQNRSPDGTQFGKTSTRTSRGEREAYLRSLERIIEKLGTH